VIASPKWIRSTGPAGRNCYPDSRMRPSIRHGLTVRPIGGGRLSHLVLKTAEGAVGVAQVTVMRIRSSRRDRVCPLGPVVEEEGSGDGSRGLRGDGCPSSGGVCSEARPAAPDRTLRRPGGKRSFRNDPVRRGICADFGSRVPNAGARPRATSRRDTEIPGSEVEEPTQSFREERIVRDRRNRRRALERFAGVYREMIGRKRFRTSVDIDLFAEVQRNLPDAQKLRIFICEYRAWPLRRRSERVSGTREFTCSVRRAMTGWI